MNFEDICSSKGPNRIPKFRNIVKEWLWNALTSTVQESFENFENLKFNAFESKDVLLNDSNDPNKNFYNNIKAIDTQYYLPSELLPLSEKLHLNSENVTIIYINLRSAKNFFWKTLLGRGERRWHKYVHPWLTKF